MVATTKADGTFSFSAAPGAYLLTIGSNSATDTTTTLHTKITLVSGANALSAPQPPTGANEFGVVYTAAQTSGNYRLTTLAGDQLSCLTGANQSRAQDGLAGLVPDEYLNETGVAIDQQTNANIVQTNNNPTQVPLFSGLVEYSLEPAIGGTGLAGLTGSGWSNVGGACMTWTVMPGTVPGYEGAALAKSAQTVWYGAIAMLSSYVVPGNYNPPQVILGSATQLWATDPR